MKSFYAKFYAKVVALAIVVCFCCAVGFAMDAKSFVPKDASVIVYTPSAGGFEKSVNSFVASLGMLGMMLPQNQTVIPKMLADIPMTPVAQTGLAPVAEDYGIKSHGDFAVFMIERAEDALIVLPYTDGKKALTSVRAPVIATIEKRKHSNIPYEYAKDLINSKEKVWTILGDYLLIAQSEKAMQAAIDAAVTSTLSVASDPDMSEFFKNDGTDSIKVQIKVAKLVGGTYKTEILSRANAMKSTLSMVIAQAQSAQGGASLQQTEMIGNMMTAYTDALIGGVSEIDTLRLVVTANSQQLGFRSIAQLIPDSVLAKYIPQTKIPQKPLSLYMPSNGFITGDVTFDPQKAFEATMAFIDFLRPSIFVQMSDEEFAKQRKELEGTMKGYFDVIGEETAFDVSTTGSGPMPASVSISRCKDSAKSIDAMKKLYGSDSMAAGLLTGMLGAKDIKMKFASLPSTTYKGITIEGMKFENYGEMVRALGGAGASAMNPLANTESLSYWFAAVDKDMVVRSQNEESPTLLKKTIDSYLAKKGDNTLVLANASEIPQNAGGYCSLHLMGLAQMAMKVAASQPNNPMAQAMGRMTLPNVQGKGITLAWTYLADGLDVNVVLPSSEIQTMFQAFMTMTMQQMQQPQTMPNF